MAIDFDWIKLLNNKLLISIECRFAYVEKSNVLLASTYLDFRYKNLAFIVNEDHRIKVKEKVYVYLDKLHKYFCQKTNEPNLKQINFILKNYSN